MLEHDSTPAAHKDVGPVGLTLEDAAATRWEALLIGPLSFPGWSQLVLNISTKAAVRPEVCGRSGEFRKVSQSLIKRLRT